MYCSAAGGYRVKTGFFRPGADALCRNDGSLGALGRRGRGGGGGGLTIVRDGDEAVKKIPPSFGALSNQSFLKVRCTGLSKHSSPASKDSTGNAPLFGSMNMDYCGI